MMNLGKIALFPIFLLLAVESRPSLKGFKFPNVGVENQQSSLPKLPAKRHWNQDATKNIPDTHKSGLNLSLDERILIYPVLLVALAPSIAPFSEKLFDGMVIMGKHFVDIALQLLKEIGACYRTLCHELVKDLGPSANFVKSVVLQSFELSSECIFNSVDQVNFIVFQKFPELLRKIQFKLASCWKRSCQKTSSFLKYTFKMIVRTKTLVSRTVMSVGYEVTNTLVALTSAVAYTVEYFRNFVVSSIKKTTNLLMSSVLATFYFFERGVSLILKAIAMIAASTCAYASQLARNIRTGIKYGSAKIRIWAIKVCDAMPFMERSDNGYVLTETTQAILYIASVVAGLNPSIQKLTWTGQNSAYNVGIYSPRTLFMTGSLARGIQLSTSLAFTIQSSLGFGALINLGAIVANQPWVTYVTTGWFSSSRVWKFFGTTAPVTNRNEEDKYTEEKWFRGIL